MDYNHQPAGNQPQYPQHPQPQQPPHHNHHHGAGANFPQQQHAMGNAGPSLQQQHQQHQQQSQMPRGPQQFYQQNNHYSQNNHYNQSSPTAPVTAAQKFAQTIQTQTSSPQSHVSPYSTPQTSQPPSDSSQASPMAAPSSTQPLAQQAVQNRPVPQSPLAPEAQIRERERMALLLDINAELLQELSNLHEQGKGGTPGGADGAKPDQQLVSPSKEYLELLRRLQANLAFQASTAEKYSGKASSAQPGPAIMSAPAAPAVLHEMYTRLQALFPGWKGQAQVKNSPGPAQRQNLPPHSGGSGTNLPQDQKPSV